jgi:hypothetical protein
MTFRTVNELAAAEAETGRFWQQHFLKTTLPAGVAGRWVDHSVGAGQPLYNAYVGTQLEFTPLVGAGNRSVYMGPSTGAAKFIQTMQVGAASGPQTVLLLDYLGFYPLLDGDTTDAQLLDNAQTLPRYTSGEDVQAFLVAQVPMTAAAQASVTMSYTNSTGASGRSVTFGIYGEDTIGRLVCQTAVNAGAGGLAPFVPLANGDGGIRSVQSLTLSTATGGLFNLVLARPIASVQVFQDGVVAEKNFVREGLPLPRVENGAFLQFLSLRGTANAAAPFRGFLDFAWS